MTEEQNPICIDCDKDCQVCEKRIESGPPAVIGDIDGTLVTFEGVRNDKVQDYLDSFEDTEIIIITARTADKRAETEAQLDSLDIDYDQLLMKPNANTDSTEYKKAQATRLLETYNVMVAVDDNEEIRAAYADLGITAISPSQVPASSDDESMGEERAVDLTPPAFMRAAARQGLKYHAEGYSGDGLTDTTVREARAMAEGNVTADKWVRIRAWIARHLADLDAPDADPEADGYPSAGVVAHLLWGSGPSKRSAQRALEFANRVIGKIEAENEGRAKGEALSKMETRVWVSELEVREGEAGEGMTLTGYAALFNSWSEDLGGFREQIAPGAFKRSLKSRNDVKLLWNHETGEVLGSTRSGTLKLTEDERGLRVDASLPDTQRGRDAKVLIERGDVSGFSFGFSIADRGDTWNTDGNERTLKSVRLFEVSLTPFPAYQATNGTASVRGLDKVAHRSGVDADALADAVLKVEEGVEITKDERELLMTAIDSLAPQQEPESPDLGLLELKKKKLQLLEKIGLDNGN